MKTELVLLSHAQELEIGLTPPPCAPIRPRQRSLYAGGDGAVFAADARRARVVVSFSKEIRSDVCASLCRRRSGGDYGDALNVIRQPTPSRYDEALERLGRDPSPFRRSRSASHGHAREYKGMETARRVRPITEKRRTHDRDLREASAALQPVEERGAALGDTVTVNFRGRYLEPPSEEEINVQDVDVVLGGDGVVPAFTDNLLGARPEETKTFTVKYPEDFSSKGLAERRSNLRRK